MTSPFTSGPSLLAPSGDPKRQAVNALRGYAYQLYVSALAWVRLRQGERLYLEVAEDYAIVANDSVIGVQVKDTAGSGTVTINSQDVRDALDNFLDLVERNRDSQITFRYLTTSAIGTEREVAHRADGEAVLKYWSEAARTAEVKPLREAILKAEISDRLNTFIQARTDEQLRRDLLQKITWDCGEPGIADVKHELESALVSYGSDRLRLLPADSQPLAAAVLEAILEVALRSAAAERYVDAASLLTICDQAGRISIPKSVVENLIIRNAAQQQTNELALSIMESVDDLPMPTGVLPRHDVVQTVIEALNQSSVVILSASTGMGKTVLSRLSASAYGGAWMTVDFRSASPQECESKLGKAQGEAAIKPISGVILDDLNELAHPRVAAGFGRFLRSLKRNNASCIVTCYKALSPGSFDKVGLDPRACLQIPALKKSEVASLVEAAGGDPQSWTPFVRYVGGRGHPQLVRVVIAGLKQREWPISDLVAQTAGIGSDIEEEREGVRRALVEGMGEPARKLLYRASLAIGRFERKAVLQLGEIAPQIQSAGEYLDALIGPWIDSVGSGMLRVSPLIANAGENALLPSEQISVHQMFADYLWAGGKLNVRTVDDLFIHSLKGKSDAHLIQLGGSLLRTRAEELAVIAQWFPSLRYASLSEPIVPHDPAKSFLFRLNQFVLCASVDGTASPAVDVWRTIESETLAMPAEARSKYRMMAIGKALIISKLPLILPNWFSMLRELRNAVAKEPMLALSLSNSETNGGLFISQAIHVASVKAQLALFKALDGLDDGERDEYMGFTLQTRGGTAALVNGPWLEEVRVGSIDGLSASQAYQQMAELTRAWGHPSLTTLLMIAGSIMLDEYAGEPEQALKIVKEAESEFGADLDLARAKSKIYLRQHRHHDVVSILRGIESRIDEFEPLQRMFLRREAGISMAETGDWIGAAAQFALAARDASEANTGNSNAMQLGLRADAALALYKGEDLKSAVDAYREILAELPIIDQEESVQAEYCSRVIRHGLLWLHVQIIGAQEEALVDGQPTVMVPGMCSNPTPPDDMAKLQRSPLDAVWYLFLTVEAEVIGATNALLLLEKRLDGKSAPRFELTFRSYVINRSIENVTVEGFADQLHRWLDFVAYTFDQKNDSASQLTSIPSYATVPKTFAGTLQTDRYTQLIYSAIVAFGISAAISGKRPELLALRENIYNHEDLRHSVTLIDQMITPDTENRFYFITNPINTMLMRDEPFTNELFEATLRFLNACMESHFRKSFEDPLIHWAQKTWRKQVLSRLAFNNANQVIPEIQAALAIPGLSGVAAIILAAEPGVYIKLNDQLRHVCRKIMEDSSNLNFNDV